MKRCYECKQIKPKDAFYKNKGQKDGLCGNCKQCQQAFNKKNAAKKRLYNIEYYNKNKQYYQEYSKDYWLVHSRRIIEHRKVSGKANKWAADRRGYKLQRTPAWLTDDDHWIIKEIYDLAAQRSRMTGFEWHVDHIIPLKGKTVCGLHVPNNLQVIPGSENIRKHNKHDETT